MRGSYSRLLSIVRLPIPRNRLSWSPQGRLRGEILFTRDLGRGTGDPLWVLVNRLRHPTKTLPLSDALFRNGVLFEEFDNWRKVTEASDIDEAMSLLEQIQPLITHGHDSLMDDYMDELDYPEDERLRIRRLPTWLVVYIASYQVRTPAQANKALLNLVFKQLPLVPPKIRPSLLVLVALSLAKFSLLAPMRRVLNIFLTIPVDHPTLHFNLLLQAIARLPKSAEAADLVVTVLEAMTSRGILLSSRTYHTLLADRFVTLQLTKLLQAKMVQQKFIPSTAHLESFVRVFSKHGAIHDAGKYLEAIRLYGKSQGIRSVPYGSDFDESGTPHPANTKYIRAFGDDRASAFHYLHKLLDHNQQWDPKASTEFAQLPLRLRRRPSKRTVDAFDWTTAFTVASRDQKTSSDQLIRLFDQTLEMVKFRPTVATYTVLIRGLICRKSYAQALGIWDRLIGEGLVLDRKALSAGLKALTLAGEPARAFAVLEMFAARPGTPYASNARVRQALSWKRPRRTERCPNQRPVCVDVLIMNDFMVALLRINRPDAVFKLWDHMEVLYNVKPDDYTLDILCRSARLAVKLDSQTLVGSLAMMGLSNPFRKQQQVEPTDREEVAQMIGRMLNEKSRAAMGWWKNAPAFEGVRMAFRQLILGNWPEMRHIQSPAHAVRRPDCDNGALAPLTEVAQSIAQSLSSKNVYSREEDSPPPYIDRSKPLHTSIVPSESTFYAYVLLLGTSSHQHEIPLVLAWMRALRIHPRRRTLCIAMIFWAEVSLRGPLFEDWAERNERSEYGKFVRWITGWVGEEGVPKDYMIGHFLKVVAAARDSRPLSLAGDASARTRLLLRGRRRLDDL